MTNKATISMTDDQIKHMVDRFLSWRLPENFSPDAGISFEPRYNVGNIHGWPEGKHEPSGTNLLDATQATAMIRYLVEGLSHITPHGEIGVKGLEWHKPVPNLTGGVAKTIIGTFQVWTHAEAEGRWFWQYNSGAGQGTVNSEEEAKAAAEAFYIPLVTAKIKSALQRNPEVAAGTAFSELAGNVEAEGEVVEPVAWRYRWQELDWVDGHWSDWAWMTKDPTPVISQVKYEVEPLYLHPPREQGTGDEALIEAFGKHTNWSLECIYDEDDSWWAVHEVNGNINDREWTEIARGDTALEAVRAALSPKATKGDGV